MLRVIFVFLLPFLFPLGADAVPVRVSVSNASTAAPLAEPLAAQLRARSHVAATETTPASQDLVFEIPVPGQKTLDLRTGSWSFTLAADRFWAEPRYEQIPEEGGTVDFVLWPTGILKGGSVVPDHEPAPERIEVHFQPSPRETGADDLPTGTVACPIGENQWSCRVPAGQYDLRLTARSYVNHYRWDVEVVIARATDLGPLHFRRGAAVVGWVETENGAPAGGAAVTLIPRALIRPRSGGEHQRMQHLRLSEKTNRRGFFHFDGVTPGEYLIEAHHQQSAPARATVGVLEDQETVISDPPLVLRSPQSLEVYVQPAVPPMGEAQWRIELAQIDRNGQTMSVVSETRVPPGGSWTSPGVPPGRFRLRLGPEADTTWLVREIEIDATTPPVFLDLPVIEVHGTVLLGDDPFPAQVRFGAKSAMVSVSFDSDAKGRFEGLLPRPGHWEVHVEGVEKPIRRSSQQVEVVKKPGKPYAEVELRVPNTKLAVEVVDYNGAAVAGSAVTAQSLGESVSAVRRRTDDEGEVVIYGLPAGRTAVVADHTTSEFRWFSEEVAVELEDGGDGLEVQLVLRPKLRIRGRVVAGDRGIPGARIKAEPWGVRGLPVFPETSDAQGYFDIHLPADSREFLLNVAAPGFALQFLRLPSDPDQLLTVAVSQESGTLVVEMPEELDRSLWDSPHVFLQHRGAVESLNYLLPWAGFNGQEQEPGNTFVIPRMEPGDYTACLALPSERMNLADTTCVSGYLQASGQLFLSLAEH